MWMWNYHCGNYWTLFFDNLCCPLRVSAPAVPSSWFHFVLIHWVNTMFQGLILEWPDNNAISYKAAIPDQTSAQRCWLLESWQQSQRDKRMSGFSYFVANTPWVMPARLEWSMHSICACLMCLICWLTLLTSSGTLSQRKVHCTWGRSRTG